MGQPWLEYLVMIISLCPFRSCLTSPQCDRYQDQAGKVGLNCSHRSLQSVPPSLPEDTQVLLLSSNYIRSVSLGSFGNLLRLHDLDLSDNRLEHLEGDRPLPLQWLNLSSNALTTIPHLGNLPHLRKLVLDDNRIVDLHQGAFKGLVKLTELSIRGNAIGHIPDRIFHPLHNLQHLNLASNRIQDFPNGALDRMEELLTLDVSNNSLRAIPTDLFENNLVLLYVYLYGNPWHCECGTANYLKLWMDDNDGNVYRYVGEPNSESVVCASPAVWQGWPIINLTLGQLCPVSTTQTPAALSLPTPPPWAVCDPLPGLDGKVGLDCSHRFLQSVPPSLPEDTQVLLLSSNSISSVSLGSFGNLSKLHHLDLSDNRLGRFEADRPLPLEWLDLSSNALTTIPHLGNLTHLRKLVLDGNRIVDLHQGAFEGLVNLTELSIRGNAIGHVPDHIFHPLHNLQHLNLASNRIQDFRNGALEWMKELKALDVSNNSLRAIPTDLFVNNTALLYVYLYDNPWHCECGTANYLKDWMDDNGGSVYRYVGEPNSESVVCASPAVWQGWPIVNLTLGQLCPVSTTQTPAALSLPTPPPWAVCDPSTGLDGKVGLNCSHRSLQSVPPSLPEDTQVLLLSSNSISSVSLGSFGNLSKLHHLDLSDNRLGRFEGDRPLPLEWLDLSSNALTTIPHLGNLTHLRKLVLDGNRIADLHQGAFEGLVKLTELSIRGNAIGHIPDHIFHPLHNLQHLNLASNRIQDFPNGALDRMEELLTLDVSNNSLRAIPTDLFENNLVLLYVYLYGNPWHCECGTANYLKLWMDDNDGNVYRYVGEPNSESVVCASPAVWQGWPIVNLTLGQLCPVSTTQTPAALSLPTPPPWAVCDPLLGLDGKVGLNCSHRFLQSVPPSLPEDTQVLLLSSNSISSVSLGSFGNLSKLRHLDLSDNRLGRFEADRPLPLEWLDLSSNALTTIPHLGNLTHLRKLVLDGNRIADLHQGAFEGLVNLTELSIRGNAIGHVPDHIFHPLHNLQHLNLASNRIQDFPNGALEWMKELKALDVSNNSLRAIPTDLFVNNTALLYVYLYDNPWHCECGTANYLKDWMDDNGGSVYRYVGEPNSESVVCASPAVWQGWPIVNLTLGQLCPVSTTQTPAALSLPTPPPWAVCDPLTGLDGKVGLNCSHRSLQSVPPSLPEDTQVLLLSSNSISSVSLGSFGNLSKLHHLDLSDNRLGRFEADRPLPLEWLDLSSNALTTIPHLGNLTHLRKLVLDGNRIADLHQGAFEGLVKLTELSIRGNAIGHIPDHIFHPLHNLQHLNLASNRIQDFPNGALDRMEELLTLDVSNNSLRAIPTDLFENNLVLLYVYLYGNPWHCECGTANYLKLWMDDNDGNVYRYVGEPNSESVVCASPAVWQGWPIINLTLGQLCPVSTTQTPAALSLPTPPPWAVCDPLPGLDGKVGLNCSHRFLQSVPPSLPEDTQVLLLSSNSISSVSLGSFGNLSKLHHLDLSDNRLGHLEGDRPLPLEWLDLSSNALTTIPHLGNLTHLRKLVLDGNRIADLPQGAFEGLGNLTELSIGGNAIGYVPDHIFHPLHNLQHLNLASNRIQDFPNGALEWMKELKALDVSNNSLRAIPTDLFVNNTALLYVYLYDNPWHCECGTANYLKDWMDDNGGSVYRYVGEPNSESVVCASPAVWQGWPIVNLTLGQLCPVSTTQTPAALSLPTPPPWAVCDPSTGLDGKVGLNCSHRSLQSVPPSLPEDTQVLLLSSNSISSVSLGSFGNLSKLHHLDLSDNRLGRFEGDRPLPLEWLDLSSNALTTIPHLGNLTHLRKLVLDGNRIADLHQGAFEGLVKLTELSIRGNAIGHIPDRIFHPLHNLQHLNLASNRIQDFPNGALDRMEELLTLDVSNNSLRAIPTDLFENNLVLLYVYLYGNPWHCECGTANYLKLWMDDNDGNVYRYVGKPDSESVVCASPAVWQGWPIVNLTLGQLCPVSTTQTPAALSLPTRPPWAVCDPSPGLDGKVGLNCSHRSLQSVPPSLPEDTQVLLLSSNSISSVSLGSFRNLSKLHHLDLSDNRLGRLEGDRPLPLEWLDLSSNALTTIPHLGNLPHLRVLVLDGNGIIDLHQGAFEGLVNLTELSIGGNAIGYLPDRIFHPLHNLQHLNLASNRIQDFPNGALEWMKELVTLDISNNSLRAIPTDLFVNNTALVYVYLYDNPWHCECGTANYLKGWMDDNGGSVYRYAGEPDSESVVCASPDVWQGWPIVNLTLGQFCPVSTTQTPATLQLPTPPPWAICDPLPGLDGKVGLNCSHRSLQSVPPSLPEDTQVLLLSSNSISSISLGSFGNLSKLRHLDLSDNRLGRLEGDRPLPLEWLDLSSNALTTIPHLGNLPHLRKLVLDGNRIADLHQGAFKGLVNLTELSIRGNAIGHVPDRIFRPLHNLRHLNLASNRIQDFPNGTLDGLVELDVSENLLSSLPPSLLGNAAPLRLALHGNPWVCDGRNHHLSQWIRANPGKVRGPNGVADDNAAVCSDPLQLNGVPLVRVPLQSRCPSEPPASSPLSPVAAKPVDDALTAWARRSGLLLDGRASRPSCWPQLLLHCFALSLVVVQLCTLFFYTLGFYRRLYRPLKRLGRGVRLVRYSVVLPDLRQVYPPPGPHPNPDLRLEPLLADEGDAGSATQGEADMLTSFQ